MSQKSKQKKGEDLQKCLEELDEIPNAETIKKAEELHRELSYISVKDLLEPCTI